MSEPAAPATKKPRTQAPARLEPQAFEFLLKEYDSLRELYSQTENSAQNIFNFYLTLITTIVGAMVLISQLSGGDPRGSQLVAAGVLGFGVAVGAAYLSALSGRYAHLARYAQGIDEMRRHLITHLDVPMPPAYEQFMVYRPKGRAGATSWLVWIFPTGTFQFFVSGANSLSVALASWLLLSWAGVTGEQPLQSLLAVLIIFALSLIANNVASRLIIQRVRSQLGLRLDVGEDLSFLAGKQ